MILKRMSSGLVLAAFMLVTAAAFRYAQALEMIDADSAKRAVQVMIGLMLAAYANIIPKDIGQSRASLRAATTMQAALRVGGWSLTLAGFCYAGFWAFTPIAFANVASVLVVAAATLATAIYGARAFVICRQAGTQPDISRLTH
jgi:hypothetical protein